MSESSSGHSMRLGRHGNFNYDVDLHSIVIMDWNRGDRTGSLRLRSTDSSFTLRKGGRNRPAFGQMRAAFTPTLLLGAAKESLECPSAPATKSELVYRGQQHTQDGSGLGKYRWSVERTLLRLHSFGRLRVRNERSPAIHQAFLSLGCAIICVRLLCQRQSC